VGERQLKGSWISNYLAFTSETEFPISYHMWVACAVLGAVTERRLWLPWHPYTIVPNLYVMLVGPSAIGKSSAADIGITLLRSMRNRISILRDRITPEALIVAIKECETPVVGIGKKSIQLASPLLVYASELSTLISETRFLRDIVTIITGLYSTPFFEYTLKSESIEIINPFLSFIGCSTPVWLQRALSKETLEGGFAGRMCFVWADKPAKLISRPVVDPTLYVLQENLVMDLEHIKTLRGPMTTTKEFDADWDHWYHEYMGQVFDPEPEEAGMHGRRRATLLKLCMILSIAENDDLIITDSHLRLALQFTKILDDSYPLVMNCMGGGETSKAATYVLGHIEAAGRIKRAELLRKVAWRRDIDTLTLAKILQNLYDQQLIEMDPRNPTTIIYRRPAVMPI